MSAPQPDLVPLCSDLREVLTRHGYTVDGLAASLGPAAVGALERSDPAGARRAAVDAGAVGALLRLLVLRDHLPTDEVARLLDPVTVPGAVAAGLLEHPESDPDRVRTVLDLRPVDTGTGSRWVFSDLDGSMARLPTRPDHVLGVGQASLSLLTVTPTSRVGSVLDLGTGCGIQLVHALDHADSAVGTDITPRCLALASATLAINGLGAELLEGPWFEPVAGRRFDRVVANPPFVVGPDQLGHSYRESGLELDGASRTVIGGAVDHLTAGGVATLLASWVLRDDEGWRQRVASWLPDEGVEAWVLQRDVSGPELYVWTWLTDEGLDPRDPATAEATESWLEHFVAHGVVGVGFGFVFLRRIDGPSTILCEEFSHPFDGGLGAEAEAFFARTAWLRGAAARHGSEAQALDSAVFRIPSGVLLHTSTPMSTGGHPDEADVSFVVERTTGPRWRHEVDAAVRMVLGGISAGALPLSEIVALAAVATGADEEELAAGVRAVVMDLLRHGIVVPAGVDGVEAG